MEIGLQGIHWHKSFRTYEPCLFPALITMETILHPFSFVIVKNYIQLQENINL